ncbi:MAG: response regulator transcription factor [Elusimicrobia bacterium]|nr:response regulator transcription factor [Elusimicrobiota bacterium]
MPRRIAVLDDDGEMLDFLGLVLTKAGFKVDAYPTPGRFFDGILRRRPSLCLIDVQLPGMDGRDIVRVLRSNDATRAVPAVLMSAVATAPRDVVLGADQGADEYFAKPFDLDLLVARIENLLSRRRQAAPPPPEPVRWKDVAVYPDEHRAELRGKAVALTRLEFQLLLAFLRQPDRVLPRSWLLQSVWESSPAISTRTVDKHVETLRRKFPPLAPRIETVVGVGYLFRP